MTASCPPATSPLLTASFEVEANTDYEVSFRAKSKLGKTVWAKFHKADWTGDICQETAALSTSWKDYTYTMNSGDNTSLVMLFQYAGYAADGQTIWLDDIVITKIPTEEPEVIPGDVNGDGNVNNRDLGILQKFLNGDEIAVDELAADLSGDGKLNNRDLGLLQKLLNT